MLDTEILDLFFARNEMAIVETDRKYGGYCFCVANSILSCTEDAEETVSDTLLHAWNAIPPQRPGILKLFLAKIARNLAFTRWRSQNAAKRGGGETELVLEELAECIPGGERVDDRLNAKELAAAIRAFLDTLPEREQDIFLRRYFFTQKTEAIAARYGMKTANVLRILSRTRAKLKNYLTQEGYDV
jgi:RNA polymerase sigma-70 factor (ECF subfamily)